MLDENIPGCAVRFDPRCTVVFSRVIHTGPRKNLEYIILREQIAYVDVLMCCYQVAALNFD